MNAEIPDLKYVNLELWDHCVFRESDLKVEVLRLDKIHPEISGNKWFKLKYYLETARLQNKHKLVSFGGAYSNHLYALAAAARLYGFSSLGMIRGEEPRQLSHTMQAAREFGMELRFLSRTEYKMIKKKTILKNTGSGESDCLVIPEGGAGLDGIRGAGEILSILLVNNYSHICCAAGTGTTLAGIVNHAKPEQKIFGISVLKGTKDMEPMDISWLNNPGGTQNIKVIHDDHFGGYARYTKPLIDFMNQVFAQSGIPTDFVYTGKLFYAIVRMAGQRDFPPGSKILVLHTGGLQGNQSLPAGLLQF